MNTTLQDSIQTFTEDPAAGRTAPAVTATLANGHARLAAGPFNWDADLPPAVGGTNQAPSPTAYLLGALAGCAVAFLNDTLAPEFGVEVESVSATARCTADLGGLLGVAGCSPALGDLRLETTIESASEPAAVESMKRAWEERCPIYLALLHPNRVDLTWS